MGPVSAANGQRINRPCSLSILGVIFFPVPDKQKNVDRDGKHQYGKQRIVALEAAGDA